MTKPRTLDLTGEWSGEFIYPSHSGPITPFVARIEEVGGQLSGTILEPHIVRGGTVEALILGFKNGASVDFTKTYPESASDDYSDPVDYVGHLSGDGQTVTGVWSLLDWDGTFEMRREASAQEEVMALLKVELEAPGSCCPCRFR